MKTVNIIPQKKPDYIINYLDLEYKIFIEEKIPPQKGWYYNISIEIFNQQIKESIAPYYPTELSLKKLVYYTRYEDDERYEIDEKMHMQIEISKMIFTNKTNTVRNKKAS